MNSTADSSFGSRISVFFYQHQISLFFILAFLISWSLLIPYILFSIANPDIDPLSNDPVNTFNFDLVLLNIVAMLAVVIVLLAATKGSLSYNSEQ